MLKNLPKELKDRRKTERDFFASAGNLCGLYGMILGNYDCIPYPQNIRSAFAELKTKMTQKDRAVTLKIVAMEESSACIATLKSYDTGMTLFYLPVEPLFKLLKDKKRKGTAELLLSVCAYLYQIVGVPYHTEDSSYLNYIYDMVGEWSSEPEYFEEQGEQEVYLKEITRIRRNGEWLAKKISSPLHLKLFGKRLQQYLPVSESEAALKITAERFYRLMQDFPHRSVLDNIHGGKLGDCSEERSMIGIDQYLSFMWSNTDCLSDQLMESVNAELNECNEMDMPLSIQFFDSPQTTAVHDLKFEAGLFDLLHEISDNLNDFAHEKHHTDPRSDISAL